MQKTQRTHRFAIAVATLALVASSCSLVRVGGGGGGAPCHEGTWELSGQTIADAVGSIFGDLAITPDDDGMTLVLDGDNTFEFSGSQTLGVAGSTPYGSISGTVDVTATVAGAYTTTSTTITFTLGSISGSAQFGGTVNGSPFSGSWTLQTVGLDEIYGLSGTAAMSCSGDLLTIDFGDVVWDF